MIDPFGSASAPSTFEPLRCVTCSALLAELVTIPFRVRCRKCGTVNDGSDRGEAERS